MSFVIFQPNGSRTFGLPPIYRGTRLCQECGQVHEFETCPVCGSWLELGFGLMFGGNGGYKYCGNPRGCGWFWKECWSEV